MTNEDRKNLLEAVAQHREAPGHLRIATLMEIERVVEEIVQSALRSRAEAEIREDVMG